MKRASILPVIALSLPASGLIRATASASVSNQVHDVRGVVREIDPDRRKVVVSHEAIANYMPAMTMGFLVRDTNELSRVVAGDTITFLLTTTQDTHWIHSIQKTSHAIILPSGAPQHANASGKATELKPGDLLPDCELLAEDGSHIRFSDLRGKAIAFTFFFTRCPLPDYCPRMNGNFSKARRILLDATNAPANWQFLSISFDPDFDQPAALASYANFYRKGNTDRWLFAAASTNTLAALAPRLDLMITREGGSISHNLRTVLLDPSGRIYRQFDGNAWTPQDLVQALLEAAGKADGN